MKVIELAIVTNGQKRPALRYAVMFLSRQGGYVVANDLRTKKEAELARSKIKKQFDNVPGDQMLSGISRLAAVAGIDFL